MKASTLVVFLHSFISFYFICHLSFKPILVSNQTDRVLQCGHGFALNENGRCTGKLQTSVSCVLFFFFSQNQDKKCVSFPCLTILLPQMKMSVPSSPLCAPLTALSAPTPTAAISAAPRGDATRALSPTMMARPVWVSGPGRVRVDLAGLLRSGEQRKHCQRTRCLKLP